MVIFHVCVEYILVMRPSPLRVPETEPVSQNFAVANADAVRGASAFSSPFFSGASLWLRPCGCTRGGQLGAQGNGQWSVIFRYFSHSISFDLDKNSLIHFIPFLSAHSMFVDMLKKLAGILQVRHY